MTRAPSEGKQLGLAVHKPVTEFWPRHGGSKGLEAVHANPSCAVLDAGEAAVQPTKGQNPRAGVEMK